MGLTSDGALRRLEEDDLVRKDESRYRTTRRWQSAMARAALRLMREGASDHDLRLPVASALVELHPELSDHDLATLVEAMMPIEVAELAPVARSL